jgi:nitrate reductase delta subunit
MAGTRPGMTMLATMRSFGKKAPEHGAMLKRVREWVRERFRLGDEATVLVSEISCQVPGCPPIETVIAFWTDKGRHHLKVFKPVADVTADDLPPSWMRDALVMLDPMDCECC